MKPYERGLLTACVIFVVILLVCWVFSLWLIDSPAATILADAALSCLVGLIVWARAQFSELRTQIAILKLALEKMQRERA